MTRRKSRSKQVMVRPEKVYQKPVDTRCPRCGSGDTVATRTADAVQYRVCRHPVCHHNYKVIRTLK